MTTTRDETPQVGAADTRIDVTFVDGAGRRWVRRNREIWRRGADSAPHRGIVANGQWVALPDNNEINISAIGNKLPMGVRPVDQR